MVLNGDEDGLVAYLPLQQNGDDLSSTKNDAVAYGDVTYADSGKTLGTSMAAYLSKVKGDKTKVKLGNTRRNRKPLKRSSGGRVLEKDKNS